jgi:3-oxoacyl-[acyl-carrier-protein] synthase-3
LPSRIVTNEELSGYVDTSDEWIQSRTGIVQRRFAGEQESTASMATAAGSEALEQAGVKPEQVDLVIVATSTPDYPVFPSTACLVQQALGLTHAGAYDVSAACSGFVYGLITACQFIQTGVHGCILLVGADTLSRFLDLSDRGTCVLFGDAAGAAVIQRTDKPGGLLSFVLGADGSGAEHVIVRAGGSRHPINLQRLQKREHTIRMNGREVYRFSTTVPGAALEQAARDAGATVQDLDVVVAHQANVRILQTLARNLALPEDRFYANVDKVGNTGAASIPLALYDAHEEGRVAPGSLIGLVGFGAGLTWATALWRWHGVAD